MGRAGISELEQRVPALIEALANRAGRFAAHAPVARGNYLSVAVGLHLPQPASCTTRPAALRADPAIRWTL